MAEETIRRYAISAQNPHVGIQVDACSDLGNCQLCIEFHIQLDRIKLECWAIRPNKDLLFTALELEEATERRTCVRALSTGSPNTKVSIFYYISSIFSFFKKTL